MRFFIALEITNENKAQIRLIQQEVGKILPRAKLTNLNEFHLTLAFIGEQPDTLKEKLIETITRAASGVPPFSVVPSFIGGFPHLHRCNVIWVGVNGQIDKLMIIQEKIQTDLAYLHLPTNNRPFTPHITIAKQQGLVVDHKLQDKLQNIMRGPLHPIEVNSIKLFESIPDQPARIATSPDYATSLRAGQSVAGGGFHTHNTLAEIKLR